MKSKKICLGQGAGLSKERLIRHAVSMPQISIFLFCLSFFVGVDSLFAQPTIVKVVPAHQSYSLLVNAKPFYIQGAGVGEGFGSSGENYIRMAKELGANAVRTWGIDQGTSQYFDEAKKQGLYVAAGLWLDSADPAKNISYINDNQYTQSKEKEVLGYVKKYKDDPSILMWGVGNEAIAFTKSEDERVAFARFLERLVKKIHALDPNHPVFYASSGKTDLPYLKKYTSSLDIIGINDYSEPQLMENSWLDLGYDAPYLLTEFGARGSWDLPKDAHGKHIEQNDYAKATQVRNYWKQLKEKRGDNIGGFVFQLGETTQESLTAYNINEHGDKREAFLLLQSLYKGEPVKNHAPRIKAFKGVPLSIAAGSAFDVEFKAVDPEGDPLDYTYRASTAIEGVYQYRVNREIPLRVIGNGKKVTLIAPEQKGLCKIYGFVRDNHGNISSVNSTLDVV